MKINFYGFLSGDGSKREPQECSSTPTLKQHLRYADFCVSCSDCCHPLATEAFSSGMFKELNRYTRSMGSTQLRDIARSCLSTNKLLSLNLLNKLDNAMARRGNTSASVRLVIASLLVLIVTSFHGSQSLTFSLAKRIQEVASDEGISSIQYLEKVSNNAKAYRKSSEVAGRFAFMYDMQKAWTCCACSFLSLEFFAVFSLQMVCKISFFVSLAATLLPGYGRNRVAPGNWRQVPWKDQNDEEAGRRLLCTRYLMNMETKIVS